MKTLLVTALTLLVVTAGWGAETRAFASYWTEFKAAVAKGDKEKVASMTKFPFVNGSEQLSKADFIKKYDKIFSEKTQSCFRKAKPVKEDDRDSYSVFCDSDIFVFQNVKGEYRLTDIGEND